ncbi:hypothetical protein RQP46_003494 [Phenoliferia psychrophenolica]
MGLRFKLAYGGYVASIAALAHWVNSGVPNPYMDEIIHIPQAQAYCNGDWRTWDTRLTTPPGLYLLSALIANILPFLPSLCSPPSLRLPNAALLALLPLIYSRLLPLIRHPILRASTRGKRTPSKAALDAIEKDDEQWEGLVIGSFPVVAFFGFLYYTDLASIFLVLVAQGLALRKNWAASAIVGGVSLWFRQTNILWVVYIAATAVVHDLESRAELYDPPLTKAAFLDIPFSLVSLASHSVKNLVALSPIIGAYLPVGLLSAAFVLWNGGIVLGDKTNHVPTLHVPQLYYFFAFAGAFLAPVLLSPRAVRDAVGGLAGSFKRATLTALTLAVMCWTIKHYTISHLFVLSDNRHYVFYVWRRILNPHPLARYFLAPFYLLSFRLIFDRLSSSSPTLSLLPPFFLLLSTSLTLIPSPLIEPSIDKPNPEALKKKRNRKSISEEMKEVEQAPAPPEVVVEVKKDVKRARKGAGIGMAASKNTAASSSKKRRRRKASTVPDADPAETKLIHGDLTED